MRPIIELANAKTHTLEHGDRFAATIGQLAEPLGAEQIGANVTRVPPGKAAFPMHHHYANEEHFFILSGHGVLRLGAETHAVKPQDYIVTLAGGPERAHQFVNSGTEDLVYLAISTKKAPEVVGYPDSEKTGVMVVPWGQKPRPFMVEDAIKPKADYWDGEDGQSVAATIASAAKA